MVALVGTIPGSYLEAQFTTRYLSPQRIWQLALALFTIVTIAGAMSLSQETKIAAFVWGFAIGILLGWHYPAENLIFSLCLPKGQDTEFSGFFIYCTQILVWLPPLIFSPLVNCGVSQNYGMLSLTIFFVLAILCLQLMPSWP